MGLHTELDTFVFLSSDNRPDIGFGQGDNPVFEFGGWVSLKKLLLFHYLFDSSKIVTLMDVELYFSVVVQ